MARRNLISEYIAAHPENTVWTPETGWQDRKTPAEMYSQGYVFSFHDQRWIYPTDTVSQRELEELDSLADALERPRNMPAYHRPWRSEI